MATSVYQQGGQGTSALFPNPIITTRDPATTDRVSPSGQPYQVFQGWNNSNTDDTFIYLGSGNWAPLATIAGSVNELTGDSGGAVVPTAGNINIIGGDLGTFVGSGSTLTYTENASAYPITPYVVGASGEAGYATIQDALDAADAAGGGVVYVQPGTYTEDLTLYDGAPIIGTSYDAVTITGVHTPPDTGAFMFQNLTLTSATDIFTSASAGSAVLQIVNCEINVTAGFVFDLDNWTGTLAVGEVGSSGTDDGFVNNTGGATIVANASQIGAGTTQTMVTSGSVLLVHCEVDCPIDFQTGSIITIGNSSFADALTFSNDSTGSIEHSSFSTGAAASITMSSSAALSIIGSSINSSANPSIAGAGAGVLTLGDISFLDNSAVAGTLTTAYADIRQGDSLITGDVIASGDAISAIRSISAFNTDNTMADSDAAHQSVVGGTSAGDAIFQSSISGGDTWTWGLDNSTTNDDFVMSFGTVLGTNNVLEIDGSDFDITIAGSLTSNIEEVSFTGSPLLQASADTGVAPTGGTGDLNLMQLQNGQLMEQFILGAGQTIIAPRMTSTGLLTSLDLTNTEGAEYNFGAGRANSPHTFVVGTSPAFFFEVEVNAADIGGLNPWQCGFRKVQANDATLTNYTDFASIGAYVTGAADTIYLLTQLASGGLVATTTTDAWTDGQTKIFRVEVDAAGAVTYTIDGVAPSATAAFSFSGATVVAPFIRHIFGAATPGAINWIRYRVGLQ